MFVRRTKLLEKAGKSLFLDWCVQYRLDRIINCCKKLLFFAL